MRITTLKVRDFRSFVDMEPIELGQVNVFIGPNNAGKSSLLRAVYVMQGGTGNPWGDIRLGAAESVIEIGLTGLHGVRPWEDASEAGEGHLTIVTRPNPDRASGSIDLNLVGPGNESHTVPVLPPKEPDHILVPYFSKRKAVTYQEDVREEHALRVSPQFDYLPRSCRASATSPSLRASGTARPARRSSDSWSRQCLP